MSKSAIETTRGGFLEKIASCSRLRTRRPNYWPDILGTKYWKNFAAGIVFILASCAWKLRKTLDSRRRMNGERANHELADFPLYYSGTGGVTTMSSAEIDSSVEQLKNIVQKYWGFPTFLPLQEQAMRAVMDGRDSLIVL